MSKKHLTRKGTTNISMWRPLFDLVKTPDF